jgi:hypothetical protein
LASQRPVFEAIADEIDGWWCHRSQSEGTLLFEGGLGGQLLERGLEEVTVLGVVSAFERASLIRLEGQLLLPRSVESVVTFEVQGEAGAGLTVTHEWRGDRLIKPSALRHSWGELLGGCLGEYVDARFRWSGTRVERQVPDEIGHRRIAPTLPDVAGPQSVRADEVRSAGHRLVRIAARGGTAWCAPVVP